MRRFSVRWTMGRVDADTTLVGGSHDLIANIVNSPLLTALPIAQDASQPATLNPW